MAYLSMCLKLHIAKCSLSEVHDYGKQLSRDNIYNTR
jgi:hypothetical protein